MFPVLILSSAIVASSYLNRGPSSAKYFLKFNRKFDLSLIDKDDLDRTAVESHSFTNKTPTLSDDDYPDIEEFHHEDFYLVEAELERLKQDVKKKRAILEATEIAVRKTEELLIAKRNASTFASCDYGYSIFETKNTDHIREAAVPKSALRLGIANFLTEVESLISRSYLNEDTKLSPAVLENRAKIKQLQLSNEAIWAREKKRPPIVAPWIIKAPYYILCLLLDKLFEGNPISRFYFLETVARMPYFSYITMLHTYETLGWWRRSAETKRVHFAEEMNEYHHLLIMESLGGDREWRVRFFAQHASIIYYFTLIVLWVLSPSLAYNFSELIEAHAVDTYAEFAESNKELMKALPPPRIAKQYYEADDMYVFDEFQTGRAKGSRRPRIDNLYDVFCNIRDDEGEHVSTMAACQDPNVLVRSPNTEAAVFAAAAITVLVSSVLTGNLAGVEDSDLSVDSIQAAIQSFDFDTILETILGGAAVSGTASEAVETAETAGNAAASEGLLLQLLRILGNLKYLLIP